MSNVALFITGAFFTLPVAGGLYVLFRGAIADGRENDLRAEQAKTTQPDTTIR